MFASLRQLLRDNTDSIPEAEVRIFELLTGKHIDPLALEVSCGLPCCVAEVEGISSTDMLAEWRLPDIREVPVLFQTRLRR